MLVKSHVKIEMVHKILNLMMVNVNQVLKQVKSNQRKNHHQKRNHQVVEVTTMTAMMMDMSVVIVLKLKSVDGLNIMLVKSHLKIEMVHMILNLMMVNVNQVLKQVKSNQRKNHHQKRNHQVVEVTTMKVMRPRLEGNWQKVWLYKQDLWKVKNGFQAILLECIGMVLMILHIMMVRTNLMFLEI